MGEAVSAPGLAVVGHWYRGLQCGSWLEVTCGLVLNQGPGAWQCCQSLSQARSISYSKPGKINSACGRDGFWLPVPLPGRVNGRQDDSKSCRRHSAASDAASFMSASSGD